MFTLEPTSEITIDGLISLPLSIIMVSIFSLSLLMLVYAYNPPITQSATLSFVPWIATGPLLNEVINVGAYPPALTPLLSPPGAYLASVFVPLLAWVVILDLSSLEKSLPAAPKYVGSMGVGVLTVLLPLLIFQIGSDNVSHIVYLLMIPAISLLGAFIVILYGSLVSSDLLAHAKLTGGFTAFSFLMHGIVSAIGVIEFNQPINSVLHKTLREIVIGTPFSIFDWTILWGSAVILLNAAIALILILTVAPYTESNRSHVHGILGIISMIVFGTVITNLLAILAV